MKKYLALVELSAVLLAGCSNSHSSSPDVDCAAKDGNGVPTCVYGTNVKVVQNPSGFRNVLIECFGTTGFYITSRGDIAATPSDLEIYPNDPRCVNQAEPTTPTTQKTPS